MTRPDVIDAGKPASSRPGLPAVPHGTGASSDLTGPAIDGADGGRVSAPAPDDTLEPARGDEDLHAPRDARAAARAARRRASTRDGARDAVAVVLRVLRERVGLTQEQLGARAGLHRTYVGGYERQERRLTVEAVEQVLAALGVSWATFGTEMDARVRRSKPRRTPGGGRRPPPG